VSLREVSGMTTPSFSIRSEADVLALVPFTLGFHPEDSLVLVTLGRRSSPFHARIDLPDDVQDLPVVVDQLVHAAVANDGDRAMVVAYTDDACLAEAAVRRLVNSLAAAGIEPLLELRADGRRWYPLGLDHLDLRSIEGVPYDVRTHELTSQAVLEGKVTFRNREELADSLTAVDPDLVEEVSAAYFRLGRLGPAESVLAAEARWLVEQARARLGGGDPVDVRTAARMLRALAVRDVRDLVWCEISRANAPSHVQLWRELVRRSPPELVAPAAGLLAFSAWLSGDGALAWCAVERSLGADPDHTLGQLVGQALEAALPPSSWQPPDPRSCRLHAG
jgi:hypothetical protein